MSVHVCPICNGKGQVPPGFYSGSVDIRGCMACDGKGVIVAPDVANPMPQAPYSPLDDYLSTPRYQ